MLYKTEPKLTPLLCNGDCMEATVYSDVYTIDMALPTMINWRLL